MLRAARERQGLTLQQLSETTKISPSVLTAIEANDVGQLPGGLFIRAFVRSYAAEVGLDPEQTVDALLEAYPDQRHDTVVRPPDELAGSHRGQQQPGMTGTAIGLLVISVIVVGLLLFFGLRSSNGSDGERENAVDDVVADGANPSVEVTPPRVAPPAPAGSPFVAASASRATEPEASGPLTVDVHPTAPCWVSVTIDGERVFAGVMGAGEREVYEANSQIVLNVGDAGVFDFSINQQPGRALGDAGQVVTVEIDRENYGSFITR